MIKTNNRAVWILVIVICLVIGIGSLGFIIGCGQVFQPGGGTIPNYTISGKVSKVTAQGLTLSSVPSVTHIVAIGANNEKYLADYDASTGTFGVKVNTGWPYAVGFYNKSGGTITLLGYLKQKDVDWDSLPIMNPTGEATDLGTIEVNATSVEAISSIDLTSLIAQMNMVDQATASFYGAIDDTMSVFTNLDVDSNGEFDFQEGKHYLLQTYVGMGPEVSPATGEAGIPGMLGKYNSTYKPKPFAYELVLSSQGDSQTLGSSATLTVPQTVTNYTGKSSNTLSTTVESTGGGEGWVCFFKLEGGILISPPVAPAGTYVASIGGKTYTLKNFQGSEVAKVNSEDNIIYPVFNLVTNETGYIAKVNYKWKKLVNGTIVDPTAAEVKAAILDSSSSGVFVPDSPFIQFFGPFYHIYKFERDGNSLDVSGHNIKLSDVAQIKVAYHLTSRVHCGFTFGP